MPARAHDGQFTSKRRTDSLRRGVLLFSVLLAVGCATEKAAPPSDASAPLVIGVSESKNAEDTLGLSHLANQIATETLTQVAPDGRAIPRLASEWSWRSDDRQLRLKLRENVVLHDRRTLDSQFVAEALAVAIARRSTPSEYPALANVTAAVPDGRFELVLHLARPSALLPEDLSVILDIRAGPYRTVSESEDVVELERFDDFYLGRPSIERITLRSFDTLRATWAELLRGDLDMVYDVPADVVEFIRSDDVQIATVKRWYQFMIAFNSRRGPLSSPMVRRAINAAVDRDELIREVLGGSGTPSTGPFWPAFWAFDSSIVQPGYDPALAMSLLDRAGYPMPEASDDPDLPAARLRFVCVFPQNFAVWERIALKVQRDLFNVGIDMQLKAIPFQEFNVVVPNGQVDAAVLDAISGPSAERPYMFWGSARRFSGRYNVFGYENAEAERLFQTLLTTRNEAAVRSATARLQRVLSDDPPALFLAWNERARAIRRTFVVPEDGPRDPMFSLWQWQRRPDSSSTVTSAE